MPFALAARDELAQVPDHLAGSQRLLGRLVDPVAQQLELLTLEPLQDAMAAF